MVEVIFEDIGADAGWLVFKELLEESLGPFELAVSGKGVHYSPGAPLGFLAQAESATAKVGSLCVSADVKVRKAGLRMFRHGDLVDVELNLDMDDVADEGETVLALRVFAIRIAERWGVTSFFGGLEPASDPDTRLFTGNELGPIRFDEV